MYKHNMNTMTMTVRLNGFEVSVGDQEVGRFFVDKTDVHDVYDAFIKLAQYLDINIDCIDKTDDFPF